MDRKDKNPRKETGLARRDDDLSINKRDGFDFDFGYDRIKQTLQLCESIAQSGMVPHGYKNAPKKILVAAAMGARFGLDPLQSTQSIAVVNGTPTFYGDALLGMVKSSGKEEWTLEGVKAMEYAMEESEIYAKWIKHYEYRTSKIAFCVTKRKGEEEPTIQHYTIDQAKEAGLLSKDNWKKFPMRMLQMRCRSYALRDAYPDVLKGYKTYEEMQDVDEPNEYQEPLPESTGEFVETDEWNEVPSETEEEKAVDADVEEVEDESEMDKMAKEYQESEAAHHDESDQDPYVDDEEEQESSLKSHDMLAKDAIDQIHLFEKLAPLWAFVDEEVEDRTTVLEAYREREEEIKEAMNKEADDQKKRVDESANQQQADDGDLFSDADDVGKEGGDQASFGDFEDIDEEEPI